MRGLRSALPAAACAERSARIVSRLLSLDVIERARAVALFWPMQERHEVDLRALDARLRDRGVRVAYPAVAPHERALAFRFVADPPAMRESTALGIKEPSESDPEARPGELDVVVVPALAVDPSGQRIGYGGGHYDATLPRHAPPAVAVAVAFDLQLLAEVPVTAGDVAVTWVVTDQRTLAASSEPGAGAG